MQRVLYVFLIIALTGCGLGSSKKIRFRGAGVCDNSSDAYSTIIRPILTASNVTCVTCHSDQKQATQVGDKSVPRFSHTNADIARSDIFKDTDFIDFQNPAGSNLVEYMNNSHNGGSPAMGASLRAGIEQWAAEIASGRACLTSVDDDGEPINPDLGNVISEFKDIKVAAKLITLGNIVDNPATPASEASEQVLSWDLTPLSPGLGTAAFEIKLIRDTAPEGADLGSYRIVDVRVGSATNRLRVQNIKVFVNGVEKTGALNLQTTDHIINNAAFTMGAPLPFPILGFPTNPAIPIYQFMAVETAADMIAFQFTAIGPTTLLPIPPPPNTPVANLTEPEFFAALVSPVLNARCLACHRAGRAWNISGSNVAADRTSTRARVQPGNPDGSEILRKGAGIVAHAGGTSVVPGSIQYQQIADWINRVQ